MVCNSSGRACEKSTKICNRLCKTFFETSACGVIEFEIDNIHEDVLYEMLESQSLNKVPVNDMEDIIFEYLINTEIDFETIFNEL